MESLAEKHVITYKHLITPSANEWNHATIACYVGCEWDCQYCWSKRMAARNNPTLVWNQPQLKFEPTEAIKILNDDLKHLTKPWQICISLPTDPLQSRMEQKYGLTYRILEAIRNFSQKDRHSWLILTKTPAKDEYFKLMQQIPTLWYGMTITSVERYEMERNAPDPQDRIRSIHKAKKAYKLKTFVSIEPLFPPNDPLDILYQLQGVVDWIILGKYNPGKQFLSYYNQVYAPRRTFRYLLDQHIPFLIKDTLKEALHIPLPTQPTRRIKQVGKLDSHFIKESVQTTL